MHHLVICAAAAGLGPAACAQGPGGWVISVNYGPGQSSVNPGNPTCRVRVSATHDPGDYAVRGVQFDVIGGEVGWAEPRTGDILSPMNMGARPGVNVGPDRLGIIAGQLNFPGPGIFADPRSPIGVWEVAWTAASFVPRMIPVSTRTTVFDVYPARSWPGWISRLAGLAEGAGSIMVTPAPGALAWLGLGCALAGRRRRQPG